MYCEKCNYETKTTYNWTRHLTTTKHKEPSIEKRCTLCDYATDSVANFKQHLQNKIHVLLDALTPTNYKRIPLNKIDINDRQGCRGIILNQLKNLNKKYTFAVLRKPYLYVYTTQWDRYDGTQIYFELYNYFRDYFVPKMSYDTSWKYRRAISNGHDRTEDSVKMLKGVPIKKRDIQKVLA